MAADGANPQLLLEVKIPSFITWTPDGSGIVYYSDDHQLHLFDLATKGTRRITDEPGVRTFRNFSPDGKWLVFQSTRSGTADRYLKFYPSVSPDGRYVIFISNRSGNTNIWRMEMDGSNLKQLNEEASVFFPILFS